MLSLPEGKVVFSILVGSEIMVPKYANTWKTLPFFMRPSDLREGEEGGGRRCLVERLRQVAAALPDFQKAKPNK